MVNRDKEIQNLIENSFYGRGICSSCAFYRRNRHKKISKGIFPRWSVSWPIKANIVIVYEVPGTKPLSNEQGWSTEKELDIRKIKIATILHENMLLSWHGGRAFLDCIAERCYGSKWVKKHSVTEIYKKLAERIYITEYCKCPIGKNKKYFRKAAENCAKYLRREFKILEPKLKLVITAGNKASLYVFKKIYKQKSFSEVFGKKFFTNKNPENVFFEIPGGPVFMPVTHPSGRTRPYWGVESYHEYLNKRLNELPPDLWKRTRTRGRRAKCNKGIRILRGNYGL